MAKVSAFGPFSRLEEMEAYGEERIEDDIKLSKADAGYYPKPPGGFRCDNCIYYIKLSDKIGSCMKVHGPIRPQDCCNLFEHSSMISAEHKAEERKEYLDEEE